VLLKYQDASPPKAAHIPMSRLFFSYQKPSNIGYCSKYPAYAAFMISATQGAKPFIVVIFVSSRDGSTTSRGKKIVMGYLKLLHILTNHLT